jgi:hypothetical protein
VGDPRKSEGVGISWTMDHNKEDALIGVNASNEGFKEHVDERFKLVDSVENTSRERCTTGK